MKRFHGSLKPTHIILPTQHAGFGGWIEMEAFQCREMMDGRSIEIPGTRRKLASFHNLITNHGLDCIGFRPQTGGYAYGNYAHVGTGNAAESVADTTLDTFVASHIVDNGYQSVYWVQSTPPYYGSHKKRYRFSPNFGGGAINVSEIGISTQAATGGLFSRALVRTGGGVPTTVAVSATEYLDVYYTLRLYPDHVDYTTGATDDGTGSFDVEGVTYNYTIRCERITYGGLWAYNLWNGFTFSNWVDGFGKGLLYSNDAALGPVTGAMTASDTDIWFYTYDHVRGTYVASTYQNTITFDTPLDVANFTPGEIWGLAPWSSIGGYQILLDAGIPKTSSSEFYYTHRTAWTRKSLL